MDYCETTALETIRAMQARIRVVQGGTSAGKTIAILLDELNEAIEQAGILTSIVTDSMPNLRRGAMRDFLKICQATNVLAVADWNKASSTLTLPNGSVVEFFSVDMLGALGARRDRLFINEANRISWDTFSQLEPRTRQKITLDFNPVNEFWAHTELVNNPAFADAVDFARLTYKDNEALDGGIITSIERRRGDGTNNWWRVYGLGEIGSLEGNVYEGWEPATLDEIKQGKLIRYGLDFGFSNDETALVAVYELADGRLGLVELYYKAGLLPSQYVPTLEGLGVDHSVLIVADSARPEIAAELKRGGFRVIGALKNAGSVARGIARVQERQIVYCGKNLEREFLTYAWRKKRTGEILDEPEDGNDHLMDAVRYAIDDLSRPRFDF